MSYPIEKTDSDSTSTTHSEELEIQLTTCPLDCDEQVPIRCLDLHITHHHDLPELPIGDINTTSTLDATDGSEMYDRGIRRNATVRTCVYCGRPCGGSESVLSHLYRAAGDGSHPDSASKIHHSSDFPVLGDSPDDVVKTTEESIQAPLTSLEELTYGLATYSRSELELIAASLSENGAEDHARVVAQFITAIYE